MISHRILVEGTRLERKRTVGHLHASSVSDIELVEMWLAVERVLTATACFSCERGIADLPDLLDLWGIDKSAASSP